MHVVLRRLLVELDTQEKVILDSRWEAFNVQCGPVCERKLCGRCGQEGPSGTGTWKKEYHQVEAELGAPT